MIPCADASRPVGTGLFLVPDHVDSFGDSCMHPTQTLLAIAIKLLFWSPKMAH